VSVARLAAQQIEHAWWQRECTIIHLFKLKIYKYLLQCNHVNSVF
jgi:hypothetical protein